MITCMGRHAIKCPVSLTGSLPNTMASQGAQRAEAAGLEVWLLAAVCTASHMYACTIESTGLFVGSLRLGGNCQGSFLTTHSSGWHALCQALRITRAGMGKDPVAL